MKTLHLIENRLDHFAYRMSGADALILTRDSQLESLKILGKSELLYRLKSSSTDYPK